MTPPQVLEHRDRQGHRPAHREVRDGKYGAHADHERAEDARTALAGSPTSEADGRDRQAKADRDDADGDDAGDDDDPEGGQGAVQARAERVPERVRTTPDRGRRDRAEPEGRDRSQESRERRAAD